MIRYISGFDSEYITLKTNKKLSKDITDLYKKNGCWTWYDNWKWFNEESFIKDETCQESVNKYGHVFPLNLIKVKVRIQLTQKLQLGLKKKTRKSSNCNKIKGLEKQRFQTKGGQKHPKEL